MPSARMDRRTRGALASAARKTGGIFFGGGGRARSAVFIGAAFSGGEVPSPAKLLRSQLLLGADLAASRAPEEEGASPSTALPSEGAALSSAAKKTSRERQAAADSASVEAVAAGSKSDAAGSRGGAKARSASGSTKQKKPRSAVEKTKAGRLRRRSLVKQEENPASPSSPPRETQLAKSTTALGAAETETALSSRRSDEETPKAAPRSKSAGEGRRSSLGSEAFLFSATLQLASQGGRAADARRCLRLRCDKLH